MASLSTKPNRFYPSIPGIVGDAAVDAGALRVIRESIETHERRNNNYMKSFIRFEELVDLGIINADGEYILEVSGGGVPEAPQDGNQYARQNAAWTIVSSGVTDHTLLSNIGTNTHAQIDSHIADTAIHFDQIGELSDVDLTGIVAGNLMYWTGTAMHDTDGLEWDNSLGRLKLDNTFSIAWENAAGTAVDLLDFDAGNPNGDPNWTQVQLLAKWEGTDGATTYTELSPNAAAGTFTGNAQLDTAQANFGSASLLLDGTGDYVTFPDIANYDLSTVDFTAEGFVRLAALPPLEASTGLGMCIFSMWGTGNNKVVAFHLIQDSFGYRVKLAFGYGAGSDTYEVGTITGGLSTGVWYHWNITRESGTLRARFNGNYETSDFGAARADMGSSADGIRIGSRDGSDAFLNGWVDDVRLTIGTARYTGTGTYTVPTADFPVVATELEELHVGDPSYDTNIQGATVSVNGVPLEQNATHTGEVTGSTVLTVQVESITNKAALPDIADPTDELPIHDQTDGLLKKTPVNYITDGGYF